MGRTQMSTQHILSFSGGKDSTAMLLFAKERGVGNLTVVAADTGHEHPLTYDYWQYIDQHVHPLRIVRADFADRIERKRQYVREKWPEKGVPAEHIERALSVLRPTGVPFLDLCLWKGRFPSTKARFCTEELKTLPIQQQIYLPLLEAGETLVSWQGVRAQESAARAKLRGLERKARRVWCYRPLLHWTVEQVFETHRRHGVRPNPLYQQGMTRVGCMPCIHTVKSELREIAARFPEEVARVADWERLVSAASKLGASTFFSSDKTPGPHVDDPSLPAPGVRQVMDWAQTTRGGRQYDLLGDLAADPLTCSSVYGLCE